MIREPTANDYFWILINGKDRLPRPRRRINLNCPHQRRFARAALAITRGYELADTSVFIRCPYCNKKVPLNKASIDHIVPKLLGGLKARRFENLQLTCGVCNPEKGASRTFICSQTEGRIIKSF